MTPAEYLQGGGSGISLQGSNYNPQPTYNPQQTAPSTVLQNPVNPMNIPAPSGPTAAEIAAQQAAAHRAAVTGQIDSQFGDWTNRLNTNEARVNEARDRAYGQIDRNYDFQYGQGEKGYGLGNKNLEVARGRVGENRRVTIRDLINELRTAQDAGQVQLGAMGAADSSAADMMAMGYGRAATQATQDVQRQVGDQFQDIGLQQTALDAEWENTRSSLNNWKQNQLFQINESVRQQLQAIQDERQTASAARQQALNELQAGIIQNAMGAASQVQQDFNLAVSTAPQVSQQKLAAYNYNPQQLTNNFAQSRFQGNLAVGQATPQYGGGIAVRRSDEQ